MSEPFLGEITPIGFNFAPRGWAFCNGQTLQINQNQALFALLGTTYGGNGSTTFALPDLRGRVAVHSGTLPGGSSYNLGQVGGTEAVSLNQATMPAHTHTPVCVNEAGTALQPNGAVWAGYNSTLYQTQAPNANMDPSIVPPAGGSQAHTNIQPYLCVNFVIALLGVFPSRN